MWFKRFKTCDTNLTDEEWRGWPSEFNDQNFLAAVEEDETGWMDLPFELSNNNKGERVRIFTDLLQLLIFWRILSLVTNRDYSSKISKGKRLTCRLVLLEKKDQKVCMVREKQNHPLGKSFPTAYTIWRDDNDECQQWQISDKNGKRQFNINIWLNLTAFTIEAKRPRKMNHIVFHHDNARPHVERHVIESIPNKGIPHPP